MLSEMGAKKIYAISRNPEKCNFNANNIEAHKLNVLDEDKLSVFFDQIGEYDILINTATGGDRALGPFMEMDLQGYRNSFRKLL